MTGVVVLAAALLAVGTALGLLRQRHRNRTLKLEQDQMYEARRILQRAQERKDRRHLHLLVAVPLAWLAGRLSTSGARLAAATAVATMATGASVMSPDTNTHHTPGRTPAAGAGETIPIVDPDAPSYTYSPQSTTSSSVAALPPAPATGPVAVPTPTPTAPPSATVSAPATTTTSPPTTTTSSTTTTTVLIDGPVVCLNPQGLSLPVEACP